MSCGSRQGLRKLSTFVRFLDAQTNLEVVHRIWCQSPGHVHNVVPKILQMIVDVEFIVVLFKVVQLFNRRWPSHFDLGVAPSLNSCEVRLNFTWWRDGSNKKNKRKVDCLPFVSRLNRFPSSFVIFTSE